jgi:hypothetical protein
MSTAIFYPVVTLVLWTLAVLFLVPRQRFKAAREGRVKARDFAYGESENVPPEARIANRNFMNLLETPVLFYVACLTVYVIGKVDLWSMGLAWTYVALRIGHSAVHLTYNHVFHRMRVYAVSIFVLAALWIRILFVL